MPYDVVSHFITACRYLRKGGKKKRLIRLIRPSPHGCETPVKPPSNRVIAGRRKRNGITVERCVMWEILQFYRDSIRVKSCVCLKKSFPFFPTPGLLYSNGKRKKKRNPGETLRRSWIEIRVPSWWRKKRILDHRPRSPNFLFRAEREREREEGGGGGERDEEEHYTSSSAYRVISNKLDRLQSILSRRKVLSTSVSIKRPCLLRTTFSPKNQKRWKININ